MDLTGDWTIGCLSRVRGLRCATGARGAARLALLLAALPVALFSASGAQAASCSTATAPGAAANSVNAATLYQNICWLDWTGIDVQGSQNVTFNLPDGSRLTALLLVTNAGNPAINHNVAAPAPFAWALGGANSAYTGVAGRPSINATEVVGNPAVFASNPVWQLTNIQLFAPNGTQATNFQMVMADAETTNAQTHGNEYLRFITNGGAWQQIDLVGSNTAFPGIPTRNFETPTQVLIWGAQAPAGKGYLFSTTNPTSLTAQVGLLDGAGQGFAIGIVSARVTLNKTIAPSRINANDQFTYRIQNNANTALATQTSSGAGTGPFTQAVVAQAFTNDALTLSEVMAAGSVSTVGNYASSYNCTSTVAPALSGTGSSFTIPTPSPVITTTGQIYTCNFTNTAPTLQLAKQWAAGSTNGDQVTVNGTTGGGNNMTAFAATAPNAANSGTPVVVGVGNVVTLPAEGGPNVGDYATTLACTGGHTLSGTNGQQPNTLTMTSGSAAVCTYTNTLRPTVDLAITKTNTPGCEGLPVRQRPGP